MLPSPPSRMADRPLLSAGERQWRSAVTLGWPVALLGAPLVLSLAQFPLCGFRHLTGLPCPLCGGTRLCASLAQGDWGAAWAANPALLLMLGLLALQTAQWALEAWTARPVQRWRINASVWRAALALLLAEWIVRLLGFW
jgi:Protein of unknown function (DUF2752)